MASLNAVWQSSMMTRSRQQILGKRIKLARIEAELTQLELAKQIYVTQTVVSDWENGIYEPRALMLSQIAKVTGKHFDYFQV